MKKLSEGAENTGLHKKHRMTSSSLSYMFESHVWSVIFDRSIDSMFVK